MVLSLAVHPERASSLNSSLSSFTISTVITYLINRKKNRILSTCGVDTAIVETSLCAVRRIR